MFTARAQLRFWAICILPRPELLPSSVCEGSCFGAHAQRSESKAIRMYRVKKKFRIDPIENIKRLVRDLSSLSYSDCAKRQIEERENLVMVCVFWCVGIFVSFFHKGKHSVDLPNHPRDRQTDRQSDRHRHRQKQRQTQTQGHTGRQRQTDRQTDRQKPPLHP